MVNEAFHIIAETGIHARPAVMLVQAAAKFSSEIKITYRDKTVNLKSIMAVLTLGVTQGADIAISCEGEDEVTAMDAITQAMVKEALIDSHVEE